MIFAHPEDPYITITLNDRANKVLYRDFQLHPRLDSLPELVAAIVKQPDIALKVDANVVDVSTWLDSFAIEYDNHNAPERWVCFRYWDVDHHGALGRSSSRIAIMVAVDDDERRCAPTPPSQDEKGAGGMSQERRPSTTLGSARYVTRGYTKSCKCGVNRCIVGI